MTTAATMKMFAAALGGVLLAGCYASTPFPSDDDAAAADHAADAEVTPDVPDVPEDDGGADTATCPTGLTLCPSGCVDLSSDPANCGGCDNACPWGATDPDESERGCLDPGLGTYQSCCAGTCMPPSDTACAACDVPCDVGRCSGLWDASAATCEFVCLSLSGAAGDACAGPEDCAEIPSPAAACLTDAGPFFFEGGYCSVEDCASSDECGAGAECANLMRTRLCLRTCSDDPDCRVDEGYVCELLPRSGAGPYCIPPMGG